MKMECPSDWYIAFGDSYSSTISNKLSLNPCNFKCCHSARFQLYSPSKFCKILQHTYDSVPHCQRSYARTRCTMNYLWWSHMQGWIRMNPFLSIPYVWPWEFVNDTTMLMSWVVQVCRDLQVHLVQFYIYWLKQTSNSCINSVLGYEW